MSQFYTPLCYFQTKLLTFYLFLLIYFKLSNQGYLILSHSILFRSLSLLSMFHFILLSSFYSIPCPCQLCTQRLDSLFSFRPQFLHFHLLRLKQEKTLITWPSTQQPQVSRGHNQPPPPTKSKSVSTIFLSSCTGLICLREYGSRLLVYVC